MKILCRICTKNVKVKVLNNIFEETNRKILLEIKDLTSIMLENVEGNPQNICVKCAESLRKAYAFREMVINSEIYFKIEYKLRSVEKKVVEQNGVAVALKETPEKMPAVVTLTTLTEMKEDKLPDIEEFVEQISNAEKLEQQNVEYNLSSAGKKVADQHEVAVAVKETSTKMPAVVTMTTPTQMKEANNEELVANNLEEQNNAVLEIKGTKVRKIQMQEEAIKNNTELSSSRKNKTRKSSQKSKAAEKPSKSAKKRLAADDTDDSKKVFICELCGNSFKYRHHFTVHLKRHTGEMQHECEVCPAKFLMRGQLKRHMRRHTGERPFACTHCGRCFTDYSTRIKHERTHTNERPFACQQCGKAFTTSYILGNHMLIHTGERKFKCEVCNKSFQRKTHLIMHNTSAMHKYKCNSEKEDIASETCLINR